MSSRRELTESLLDNDSYHDVPDIVVMNSNCPNEDNLVSSSRRELPELSIPIRLSEDPSMMTGNNYELSSVKIDKNSLYADDNNNTESILGSHRRIISPRRLKTNYVDEQDDFLVARAKFPDGRYCVIARQYLSRDYFKKDYQVTISNFDVFQTVLADISDIESLMWKKTTGQFNELDERETCMVKCHVSDFLFESLYNRYEYMAVSNQSFRKEKKVDHEYYQSRYHKSSERTRINTVDEYFQVEDITCKQFSKNCCYALLLIVSIFIFLLIASIPIWLIEGTYEAQLLNQLTSNITLSGNETAVTYDLFNIDHWYYTNCLYFSTVTFTTVGYGDVVPQTAAGKLFVVLFGILGLATIGAMTGVLFKKLMQNTKSFLTLISNIIIFFIKLCMSCSFKSTHRKTSRIERVVSVIVKHPMSQIVYFFFLVATYSMIGALIFMAFEDWGFPDSLYFVFITLTTIGYGDLKLKTTGSKFFLIFFIISGIGLLGILLALIGGVFKRLLKKIYLKTTSQNEGNKNEDFFNIASIQEQQHTGRDSDSRY